MVDIIDMDMEVDSSDLERGKRAVDQLSDSMQKSAATSALFSRRLAGDYSMAADKIARASQSIARMKAEEARAEKARSSMIINAARGVEAIRQQEDRTVRNQYSRSLQLQRAREQAAAAEIRTEQQRAAAAARAETASDRNLRSEYRRILSLQKARDQAAIQEERARERQISAARRQEDAEDRRVRQQYQRLLTIQKAREQASAKAEQSAQREANAARRAADAEEANFRRQYRNSLRLQAERDRAAAAAERQAQREIAAAQNAAMAEGRRVASMMAEQRRMDAMFKRAEAERLRATQRIEEHNNRSGRGLLGTMSRIHGSLLSINGLIAGIGVFAVYNSLNKYTELTNILKVLGFEGGQAAEKLREIQDIARTTRSPVDELAKIYQKTTMAAKELGASQEQILQFTKNVGLALAQQGGATISTRGALLQLAQAIGMGTVRAEEFNSLLEGGYPILVAVARGIEETGGSVMKLRQMMLAGELSSKKFFDALLSQSDNLEKTFGKTVPTLSQALTVMADTFMVSIGEMDHAVGFSQTLSRGMMRVSESIVNFSRSIVENADLVKELGADLRFLGMVAASMATIYFGRQLLTAITVAGGAMATFTKLTQAASLAMRSFLPAMLLTSLVTLGMQIGRNKEMMQEYEAAVKTATASQDEFQSKLRAFENERNLDTAVDLKAQADAAIADIQAALAVAEQRLEAAKWWTKLDFGVGPSIQLFETDAIREAQAEVDRLNGQLVVQTGYLGMADTILKSLAGTWGKVAASTEGMSDKAIQEAAQAKYAAESQIALSQAMLRYGEKSIEVERIKREQAQQTALAFAVQKDFNAEVLEQYVAQQMVLYDLNAQITRRNELNAETLEIQSSINDTLKDYNDWYRENQDAIASISKEQEDQLRLQELSLKYGADHIEVVRERQQQEKEALLAQLDSLNASQAQTALLYQSLSAAQSLSNAFGIMRGEISGASDMMASLLAKLLAGLRAFSGLLKGVSAIAGAIPGLGAIGQSGQVAGVGLGAIGNVLGGILPDASELSAALRHVQEGYSGAVNAAEKLHKEQEKGGGKGKKAAKESGKAQKDLLAELHKELDYRQSLIGLSDEEIERREIAKSVIDKLSQSEKKYTEQAIQGAIDRSIQVAKEEKAWERVNQAVDTVADAWGDFVTSGFTDFKGFAESVLGVFKDMLSEMIATASRNRIMISMGMDPLSSSLGQAGAPVAQGFLSQALGSWAGGAAGGGVIGGLSGVWSGISSGFASGGVLGGLTGGLGASISGIGSGLAAGGIAGITSAIGAAIPIIGAVVGVVALAKKMFGRELKDTGIEATFSMAEGIAARTYKFYKGGWFRSDKTRWSDAPQELSDPLQTAFSEIGNTVSGFAKTMSLNSAALKDVEFSMKFSTKGMDQAEIQEKLMEGLEDYSELLVKKLIPNIGSYTKGEETAVETLQRLSVSLTTVNQLMGALGLNTYSLSVSGAAASSAFVDLFGSLDNFQQAASFYYENFYTLSERLTNSQTNLGKALKDLGVNAIPKTEAEFRKLVDRMNAAGKTNAVAELMMLAPAFIEMINLQKELNSEVDKSNEIAKERYDLETRLLTAQGKTSELRKRELALLHPSNRALMQQIWAVEKQNEINDERKSLEQQLLQIQGKTTQLRNLELSALDPSNRELQKRIWALEEENRIAVERDGLQRALLTAQGKTNELRQLELAALSPANRALQRQIWAVEKANAVAQEREGLEKQLLQTQGNTAALRRLELATLDPVNRGLQQQIWHLEDLAQIQEERKGLEGQWLELTGNTAELRRRELALLHPSNRALQERIWALEKSKEIEEERKGLEQELLEVLGKTGSLRRLELQTLDASNRALQQQIWAIEDAKTAVTEAETAARNAANAERERINTLKSTSDAIRQLADTTMEAAFATGEVQRLAAERQLRIALETGRVWDESLQSLAERAAAVDVNNFGSYTDFAIASARAASLLKSVSEEQAEQAKGAEQRLEEALQRYGLQEETVLSLTQALTNLDHALVRLANAESGVFDSPLNDPARAVTFGAPVVPGQAGVVNPTTTLIQEVKGLRDEVKQLRQENNSGNAQIARQAKQGADIQRKWDVDGMPPLRPEVSLS